MSARSKPQSARKAPNRQRQQSSSRTANVSVTVAVPGVPLSHYSVQPQTLRVYRGAVRSFLSFASSLSLPLRRGVEVDDALVAFITHQHGLYQAWLDDDGDSAPRPPHCSVGEMECAIAGCEFFAPELRRQLAGARRAVHGWKRLHVARHHPPLSWPVAVLIAATLARWGCVDAAMACLLAFDCYLRISEFSSLRVADVVVSSSPFDSLQGVRVAIALPVTKSRPNESVVVARPAVKARPISVAFGPKKSGGWSFDPPENLPFFGPPPDCQHSDCDHYLAQG